MWTRTGTILDAILRLTDANLINGEPHAVFGPKALQIIKITKNEKIKKTLKNLLKTINCSYEKMEEAIPMEGIIGLDYWMGFSSSQLGRCCRSCLAGAFLFFCFYDIWAKKVIFGQKK